MNMAGAVDATMRPLKIPPKFVPYLESHRIYDLFYDLCETLIKKRPEDPVVFIKHQLSHYQKKLTAIPRKIIFIAPCHIALQQFAERLAEEIDVVVITLSDIISEFSIPKNDNEPKYNPEKLAIATEKYISINISPTKGWILVGFPRTKAEAKALQKHGVLPTHTIELVHNPKDYSVDDLWNQNLTSWSFEEFRDMMIDYKRRANELKQVYKSSLKTIIIRGRKLEKIVTECKMTLNKLPHIGAPMLLRIVLIGIRGSKGKTMAGMLSKRFKLVHVDFWLLLEKAGRMDNSIGEEIRHTADSVNINLSLKLLEDRLLEDDCMRHGWVLTGFPNDETDFKALDTIEIPPNRYIFLQVNPEQCLERLADRGINVYSGEIMSKKNSAGSRIHNQLVTHPHDRHARIVAEHEAMASEIQYMLDYGGYRIETVDASGPINEIFERVENVVINRQAARIKPTIEVSQSLYNQVSSVDVHMFDTE